MIFQNVFLCGNRIKIQLGFLKLMLKLFKQHLHISMLLI